MRHVASKRPQKSKQFRFLHYATHVDARWRAVRECTRRFTCVWLERHRTSTRVDVRWRMRMCLNTNNAVVCGQRWYIAERSQRELSDVQRTHWSTCGLHYRDAVSRRRLELDGKCVLWSTHHQGRAWCVFAVNHALHRHVLTGNDVQNVPHQSLLPDHRMYSLPNVVAHRRASVCQHDNFRTSKHRIMRLGGVSALYKNIDQVRILGS